MLNYELLEDETYEPLKNYFLTQKTTAKSNKDLLVVNKKNTNSIMFIF